MTNHNGKECGKIHVGFPGGSVVKTPPADQETQEARFQDFTCMYVSVNHFAVHKKLIHYKLTFSSVQSLSRVRLFATPCTAALQASLSITNSWSLLRLMSIELVMPSNHLILCRPLVLSPTIVPSIMLFSNELALCIMWPQ